MNTQEQNQTNQLEWKNDENWTPGWPGVYFSQKDSRTVVPKRNPAHGWTLNMAKPKGVAWLLASLLVAPFCAAMVGIIIFLS